MTPSKGPFLHLVIPETLLDRIDDFRFENRFPTRAAAVKWLLEWGLDQGPDPKDKSGPER